MEDLFVTYEIATKLRILGFDEYCFKVGNPNGHIMWKFLQADEEDCYVLNINDILKHKYIEGYTEIPLYQQVTDWLRNVHKIEVTVSPIFRDKCGYDSFKRDGYTYDIMVIEPCQYLTWTDFNICAEDRDNINNKDLLISVPTYKEALNMAITKALALIKL
jgi:hypothetical protein